MIAEAPVAIEFDTIDDVLKDIAAGKIVIVVDDADRENEGDLIMAAEKVTPKAINFMAKHGRGLICVPTTNERVKQLGVQRMVAQNREMYQTDFTAERGRGARNHGISAPTARRRSRRSRTRESAPGSGPAGTRISLARQSRRCVTTRGTYGSRRGPARDGGASRPIGVICEIMNDNGTWRGCRSC